MSRTAVCKQKCKQHLAGTVSGTRHLAVMKHVQIAVPNALLDELVERVFRSVAAPEAEPWVGVDAASSHRACKRQRIYHLVSRRAIPHRQQGARLLFKLSHLDAWIDGGGAA
jgi:hypothetical protein